MYGSETDIKYSIHKRYYHTSFNLLRIDRFEVKVSITMRRFSVIRKIKFIHTAYYHYI